AGCPLRLASCNGPQSWPTDRVPSSALSGGGHAPEMRDDGSANACWVHLGLLEGDTTIPVDDEGPAREGEVALEGDLFALDLTRHRAPIAHRDPERTRNHPGSIGNEREVEPVQPLEGLQSIDTVTAHPDHLGAQLFEHGSIIPEETCLRG